MTAYQLIAPMPALTLDAGCTVTFEAIDPDTGAAVSGVRITSGTVYAVNLAPDDTGPPEEVIPLFAPVPTPLEEAVG